MKKSLMVTVALTVAVSIMRSSGASAVEAADAKALDALAKQAVSGDLAESSGAVAQLRGAGPAGLDAMFEVFGERIQKAQNVAASKDADWERLRSAFDAIGQQRDCFASHLYWYTDLEKAKAAARTAGKPILSLRLLGKLNEEYSCANSRFFRTTLYPNAEVSRYLRDHFVLHWQSVRPVPRITIDMGDGRRIERTITGNSIHYVLDADGNPIDALPGLYGAKTFLAELDRAAVAEQQASNLSGQKRAQFLKDYHATRLANIQLQWAGDLAKINVTPSLPMPGLMMLRVLTRMNDIHSDAVWQKIAMLHWDQARLDPSAQRLIQFKQPPTAVEATRVAMTKAVVETPAVRMLRNLQRSIAEDTVHNEYQLHAQIHEWFANGSAPANLEALNSKIYAELFLTPNSDAWLGLAPADAYSALDGGGLVQTTTH